MNRLTFLLALILAASLGVAQTTYHTVTTDTSSLSTRINAIAPDTLGWFNIVAYGAVPTTNTAGVRTANTTAIQAAINAAALVNGVVYVPAGTYYTATADTLKGGVSIIGVSEGDGVGVGMGSRIYSYAGAFVVADLAENVQIRNLQIWALAGHVIKCAGSMNYSTIANCYLVSYGDAFSAVWSSGSVNFIGNLIVDCRIQTSDVSGAPTKSIAAIYVTNSFGGANNNVIDKCTFYQYESAQYAIFFDNTDDANYAYNNRFRNLIFENATNGCIKVLTGFNTIIDNCEISDTDTIKTASFFLGKHGATNSTYGSIRNTNRINGVVAAGIYDIDVSSATGIIIENCGTPGGGDATLNVSSSTYVIGTPAATINGTPAYSLSTTGVMTGFPARQVVSWTIDSTAMATYGTRFDRGWFFTGTDSLAVDSLKSCMQAKASGDTVSIRVLWGVSASTMTDSLADMKCYHTAGGLAAASTKVIPPGNFVRVKLTEKDGNPPELYLAIRGRKK